MIIILKQDVNGTGRAGEVVKVNDGFARNMLIPRGLAIEATEGNVRSLRKQQELAARKAAETKAAAEEQAAALRGQRVVIRTKSGEGGRLFGSITSKDIAEAAEEQLGLRLDRRKIDLRAPIKTLGTFDVDVRLYQEVRGSLKVEVTD